VADVLCILDPIAKTIPETASRVRNRIALILDWAARAQKSYDNPARRPKLLPTIKKKPVHFAAMAYRDLPAFVVELRRRKEIVARALEFQILTACRPSEALRAHRDEVDSNNTWTIPAQRMKGGAEHRIPLSARVIDLLSDLPRDGAFLFA